MVTTQIPVGKVYIADYLTDGNADNQELDGKTEGVDYILIDAPKNWSVSGKIDFIGDDYTGQEGYFMRWDKNLKVYKIFGQVDDQATGDLIEKYVARQNDNGSAPEYLFYRRSSTVNDFKKGYFGSTEYEYNRGLIANHNVTWDESSNRVVHVMIEFKVVWKT